MEPPAVKHSPERGLIARLLILGVAVFFLRFAFYVVVQGQSCIGKTFCFLSPSDARNFRTIDDGGGAAVALSSLREDPTVLRELWTSKTWRRFVDFYSSSFQRLIFEGYLSPSSRSLCVGSRAGNEVLALKEIGVDDSIGVSKHPLPPLIVAGNLLRLPFENDTFDFVFFGIEVEIEKFAQPHALAAGISRVMKPEGFLAIHTASADDEYSLHSLIDLFSSFILIHASEIDGPDPSSKVLEIVLQKQSNGGSGGTDSRNKCSVPDDKLRILRSAEPLIDTEPLKPWITLKKNIKNVRYLPSMADISFNKRYIYIDVGARSYGSSIGGWFLKQYPKQNKTFEIFAIEADSTFYSEYATKKGVKLLPFAAWVRNETLAFEVKHNEEEKHVELGLAMGRIRPSGASPESRPSQSVNGFDFADWLRTTVSETDFVVVKMDIEGTEFDLVPRLFETGAICLIDELFLECHYNRWQRCCPGKRSPKYTKTYRQCLDLLSSIRSHGVLVHQWW